MSFEFDGSFQFKFAPSAFEFAFAAFDEYDHTRSYHQPLRAAEVGPLHAARSMALLAPTHCRIGALRSRSRDPAASGCGQAHLGSQIFTPRLWRGGRAGRMSVDVRASTHVAGKCSTVNAKSPPPLRCGGSKSTTQVCRGGRSAPDRRHTSPTDRPSSSPRHPRPSPRPRRATAECHQPTPTSSSCRRS